MKSIISTILLAACLISCGSYTTQYKITTIEGRNFYTNSIDSTETEITFFEPKRDGITPHFYFSVPLNQIDTIKITNHDKNIKRLNADSYTRIDSSSTTK
jgi:hypothetical protein